MTRYHDFLVALDGSEGELEAWLECNNESEVKAAIEMLTADIIEECAIEARETMARRVKNNSKECVHAQAVYASVMSLLDCEKD